MIFFLLFVCFTMMMMKSQPETAEKAKNYIYGGEKECAKKNNSKLPKGVFHLAGW